MANSNNTLYPKNGQSSKLFKFYDLTSTKVFEIIASTERQAREKLGNKSLIFIAQIRLTPITIEYPRRAVINGDSYE
ncbi:host cell division inhibitor Icd-like protein [Orbaceae bacterium ESL0727]|nr:host cell division inhibitor Icd-like protein [Orbaceae bacterium ESL0727]